MKFNPENPAVREIARQLLDYALELACITGDEAESDPALFAGVRCRKGFDNSLLYAVYAAENGASYLAVCLDDPFCYASGRDRESAIEGLLAAVKEKYGCGQALDGIEIPDYMPEDI